MSRAVVTVLYGPPSRPRIEGKAEVVETLAYLRNGKYKVRLRFFGDPKECTFERIVSVKDFSPLANKN